MTDKKMTDRVKEATEGKRGLSEVDRIALRIVSALIITGILGLFTVLNKNTTTLAIVQNDVKNLIANTTNDISRLAARVGALEDTIQTRAQDRYTYKDATKDQQISNFRINEIEKRVQKLEAISATNR